LVPDPLIVSSRIAVEATDAGHETVQPIPQRLGEHKPAYPPGKAIKRSAAGGTLTDET